MSGINEAAVKPTIELLIHEIETRANKADEHVIAAALRLRELRQRIEAGELGDEVAWKEWARANFRKISAARLYQLDAVGKADDPRTEFGRAREVTL